MKTFSAVLLLVFCFTLAAEITVNKFNRIIGLPLLGETENMWDFQECSKRLRKFRIRLQSSPGRHSAFLYGKKLLGEDCKEIVFLTDQKNLNVESVSLVFANKGDVEKRASSKIKRADKGISKELTSAFGKPEKRKLDPGVKKLRSDVELWRSDFADIMLDTEKGEYCMITIRPPAENTEKKTAANRIDTASLQKNIRKNDFGDIFITNIPMVNQGQKGYCAVATASRVMLYFGIKELNQHKLADVAETGDGGGTYTHKLLGALNPLMKKYRLKLNGSKEPDIKFIARYIDMGVPVFWQMFSTEQYNKARFKNTAARLKAKSPEEWEKKLRKQKKIKKPDDEAHICLIIGYNEITGEIAVSNSWGEMENRPTWVAPKVAAVVNRGVFVIFP